MRLGIPAAEIFYPGLDVGKQGASFQEVPRHLNDANVPKADVQVYRCVSCGEGL